MAMRNRKIVVVGATGRVGREILSILSEKGFPIENIGCIASERSAGSSVEYGNTGKSIVVQDIKHVVFSEYDIGLFSAGSEVSKIYAERAAEQGCIVIDNTSYFRMRNDISLIVPEINFEHYKEVQNKKIIANPNCSTIQMVLALKPLHDLFGLREIVASTYQSVSGAGQHGVVELISQTFDGLIQPKQFKKQIAFNIIPQIDNFDDSLYTKEELKMINETRKILNLPNLQVTATCARVPVTIGHCVSVFAKFDRSVNIEKAVCALENFEGIKVMDNPSEYTYATPVDAASKDEVFVSRIRKHTSLDNAISFWCVSDNLRKGAALNAFQIAEKLCRDSNDDGVLTIS